MRLGVVLVRTDKPPWQLRPRAESPRSRG
jgi:hypothetical protein